MNISFYVFDFLHSLKTLAAPVINIYFIYGYIEKTEYGKYFIFFLQKGIFLPNTLKASIRFTCIYPDSPFAKSLIHGYFCWIKGCTIKSHLFQVVVPGCVLSAVTGISLLRGLWFSSPPMLLNESHSGFVGTGACLRRFTFIIWCLCPTEPVTPGYLSFRGWQVSVLRWQHLCKRNRDNGLLERYRESNRTIKTKKNIFTKKWDKQICVCFF